MMGGLHVCVCPCVWNEWLLPGASVYIPVCVLMSVDVWVPPGAGL